jgi:ribosomal protein L19
LIRLILVNVNATIKFIALFGLILTFPITAKGQSGIRGNISNAEGKPLEFATIYVKEIESGTTSNIEGYYSIDLAPGDYHLVFQFLGFKAKESEVTIGAGYLDLDISLEPESLLLQTVEINANREDPAYTVMRKAIAKSKFHTQQIDTYKARVYIKGSGRIVDAPFFLRKAMAKEGIDSSFTFVSESISEITYQRPSTFTERVVSVRTSGEDNNTSPNGYIMGSFYEPEIAEAISPLSPKAFAYYRFEYLGTFTDRGYAISKIRVIPRSKGDDVFSGILNIVEDYWSIYSLDLTTTKLGITFGIKQIYNPINEAAWLPVSHQFAVRGQFFGFDFEYDYLATVSNYDITLNPDLVVELTVIDEKVESELAAELDKLPKEENKSAQEQLTEGKEVTRKELRKLLKEYEKQEFEELDEPQVVENYNYSVDSTAANSDSLFWVKVRPVPLTSREKVGYEKMDSLAIVERQEAEGDTLKSGKRQGFHIIDILFGNTYRFKDKSNLTYFSPLASLNFNTVEGYVFNTRFRYRKPFEEGRRIELEPILRYSFARGKLTGRGKLEYRYGSDAFKLGYLTLSGGKYTYQYNPANPIHPLVNSFTTLFNKDNFMKLYESGYLSVENRGKLADNLDYRAKLTWSERSNLQNNTDHTWIKQSKEYTSNNPVNFELADTSFPFHKSLELFASLRYSPWQKYRIRNNKKQVIAASSPEFDLNYRKGISSSLGDTDFDYLEIGFMHNFKIGARGRLGFDLRAGKFFNNRQMYFMDFRHFMGNETSLLLNNPVGGYRLLSYYNYSTGDQFISGIAYYQFRKFLLTQLPMLRITGVKEMVFLSYLGTPTSENYFEVGYGIDNLFRILRVEAAASFQDYQYNGWGIKIGIATSIAVEDNSFSFGF